MQWSLSLSTVIIQREKIKDCLACQISKLHITLKNLTKKQSSLYILLIISLCHTDDNCGALSGNGNYHLLP